MGKSLKYGEFEFPSDKGYSGSAGKTMVKGYARGGSCNMAEGGKVARLKDTISNERKEMARVEAKQRDAGQEMSRVRSEMRYDKNEMRGMRKQYPVDRREPMIAMAKGGMAKQNYGSTEDIMGTGKTKVAAKADYAKKMKSVGLEPKFSKGGMATGGMTSTKPVPSPAPKADMLYSKKEVNAKNLLSEGKAPSLPHAKGSVNMKHGGMAHSDMAKGGMTPKQQAKVGKVLNEFKAGELHSGSKAGPMVKDRKQAIAIGLSEARKAGKK